MKDPIMKEFIPISYNFKKPIKLLDQDFKVKQSIILRNECPVEGSILPPLIEDISSEIKSKFLIPFSNFLSENYDQKFGTNQKKIYVNDLFVIGSSSLDEFFKGRVPKLLKVKCGRIGVESELEILKEFIKKGVRKFRIDCNGKWSPEDCIRAFKEVGQEYFDYFEEPFSNLSDYHSLLEGNKDIPLGCDINFANCSKESKQEYFKIFSAFIIKPILFKNFNDLIETVNELQKRNKRIIFSSMFESSIGLIALAKLAYLISPDEYHGLATQKFLFDPFMKESELFNNENFHIPISSKIKEIFEDGLYRERLLELIKEFKIDGQSILKEIYEYESKFLNSTVERIGILEPDSKSFIIKFFACVLANKRVFLLNHLANKSYLENLSKDFDFIIFDESNDKSDEDNITFPNERLTIKNQERFSNSPLGDFVIFTSGSSGGVKGVVHSLLNAQYACRNFRQHYKFLDRIDFQYHLPLFHIGGLMTMLRSFFCNGHYFIKKNEGNLISLLPEQVKKAPDSLLKSKDLLLLGGMNITSEIKNLIIDKGYKASFSYGMTETCAQVSGTKINEFDSNGEILPNIECKVQDKILFLKGSQLFLGYETTSGFIENSEDWFSSRDLLEVVDQKKLRFLGRSGKFIKIHGENINLSRIQNIFQEFCNPLNCGVEIGHDEDLYAVFYPLDKEFSPTFFGRPNVFFKDKFKKLLTSLEIPRNYYLSLNKNELTRNSALDKVGGLAIQSFVEKERSYIKIYEDYLNSIKTGSEVLFIHGLFGGENSLENIANSLDRKSVLLTLPGHQGMPVISLYKLCELLKNFILKREIKYIYGYSMGGRILLETLKYFSKEELDSIERIVLESVSEGPSEFLSSNFDIKQTDRLSSDLSFSKKIYNFSQDQFLDFLKDWYKLPMFKGLDHNYIAKNLNIFKRHNYKDLGHSIFSFSPGFQSSFLDHEKFPFEKIIFLAGECDKKYLSVGKRFEEKGARLKIFGDVGHNIYATKTLELQSYLKENFF